MTSLDKMKENHMQEKQETNKTKKIKVDRGKRKENAEKRK